MTPRPYHQSHRRTTRDQTEARVLKAARELLFSPRAGAVFSLEAVARRAKVTRRTVYLRFGSRRALIEAAFDSMAEKNGIRWLPDAFQEPDPRAALMQAIALFAKFFANGRAGMRRVRAHAEFDAELAEAIDARNERRRTILRTLIGRLAAATGYPPAGKLAEAVDLAYAVSGFETFDSMSGAGRTTEEITASMQTLVGRIVDPL
jgi:AcrR family transcriptional regulator